MAEPIWRPSESRVQESRLRVFGTEVVAKRGANAPDMASLHAWSLEQPAEFWSAVWDFSGVIGTKGDRVLEDGGRMPGARWFPNARLNYAENLLRRRDDAPALIAWGENKVRRTVSFRELSDQVAKTTAALRKRGIRQGDRVAGLLPNIPESVAVMLAATSIGAIWSSCSPDFGIPGVLDRFGQIEPRILFGTDGYYYNGKVHMASERLGQILKKLPTVETLVTIPYVQEQTRGLGLDNEILFSAFMDEGGDDPLLFEQLPFDHPLFIMYSSGTTGAPKCIVHGAGGTLLQHLKEHQLHCDVRRDDRVFYFTTCGWMMWNWLVTALASDATVVLYDGSPVWPRPTILWDLADKEGLTFFGTSAKYLDALKKTRVRPRETHDLSPLRTIASTESPLVAESFEFVYEHIKEDVCLSSISGGTDIISCFVLGDPTGPVWRGEIQCRGLGMAVDVFDEDGEPVRGDKGELVCTAPFPSMPTEFWNDPDGSRYRSAYFDRFPGIWCHGDWVEFTDHGGMIIHGRSDAVLNPGGVRIGTAEIYRQVEQLDAVLESFVVGQDWQQDVRVILFVRLREGVTLDKVLADNIRTRIRENTTPRHVPSKIMQVPDIPRTKSGKITELAVKNVIHGRPVKNREALANPEALDLFANIPGLQEP